MLSSVEFHIIDNKSGSTIFFIISQAHAIFGAHFIALKDGCSIKIKDKFLSITFKPRIYL